MRLKADVLIDLKRQVEAGIVVEFLAQLAEANPSLEKDPVSLWSEAVDLFEEGGSLEAAATAMQRNAPRAGQGGANTLADPNVDSIDMLELGDDMLSHSHFADDRSALADMASLFWKNVDPGRRCGLEATQSTSGSTVWKYRQGICASRSLIDAMAHLRLANPETADQMLQVLSETTSDPALLDELVPVVNRLLFGQSD